MLYCLSMDTYPYLVRRARLLTGEKQAAFATHFGVDEATVSGWENGKARPSPKEWSWIHETVFRSSDIVSEAVRAARTHKCVVSLNDLTCPTLISRGVEDALGRVGIESNDLTGPFLANLVRSSPHYDISGVKALSIIQANQSWIMGEVIYAEAHCFSPILRTWLDCVIAPLPGRRAALIEAAQSSQGEKGGFWVRFVQSGDSAGSVSEYPQIIQ
ncbi:MAG: helix-turn-helix domain-containing protein [Rhodomicrobium sp.]